MDDGDESKMGSRVALVLVLDGSGSTRESGGEDRTRIEAAKEGLNHVIDDLPTDATVSPS